MCAVFNIYSKFKIERRLVKQLFKYEKEFFKCNNPTFKSFILETAIFEKKK